mmetsp:Transcript_32903/g.106260  ORF Transcript_32903/g.106260 Transcript_32903/m.106260 type:complete len:390 (+) Transcript_32903:300-1469(+)
MRLLRPRERPAHVMRRRSRRRPARATRHAVVLEQRVHDRAAVPKRAHAAGAEPARLRVARRRGRQLGRKRARDAVERLHHVRVDGAQLAVRRRHPVTHTDRQPQQTRDARRWLGVPAVRLDAPHRERLVVLPPRVQRGERARLDRVAQRRARAVSLHASHLVAQHRGVGERGPQQRPLRLAVGRRQARALAVLPHAAAQRRGDRPASRRASLQKPRAARLATGVPVGPAVEGVGPAERRQHARDSEAVAHIGEQHQADAGHQPALALAEPQRTRGRVAGCERSRAGSVVGDSRPLHAEDVRQAARSNRMASSCRMVDATGRSGLSSHKLKVVRGDADEHSRQAAVQRRPLEAGCVQSAVAPLEQQALLRVHCARLRWRHAEVAAVEPVG